MKILRVIARLNVGGPAKHVVWLTAGLRNAECETLLVAGTVPPGEDDMGYFADEMGVAPVFVSEMSREVSIKDALSIWKLYRLFLRERPDIVHTHTAKAGTVGRVAGLFYRWATPAALIGRPRQCRFVHTYHGHIFHSYYGAFKTRLFVNIERALARLGTDRIIVISEQQRREIHEEFKVGRASQFAVIPLGLDTRVFAHWNDRRRMFRTELGAGDSDILVGIVGRLTEIKNHDLFLRAAALYKEKLGDLFVGAPHAVVGAHRRVRPGETAGRVRFVVIGDGRLRRKLEDQARTLGLSEDVTFAGSRKDPEFFYPALDIVALTSRNEGTPLTLIEAMLNARPVIATAVGGVVDLLGDVMVAPASRDAHYTICQRGIRVRPNDAAAFAEALAPLIDDEELRRETGERGRQFAEQQFAKERLLDDISRLYRELIRSEPSTMKGRSSERSLESRV
jgi:glycosyltransferase involved in cell wall biosynthesis